MKGLWASVILVVVLFVHNTYASSDGIAAGSQKITDVQIEQNIYLGSKINESEPLIDHHGNEFSFSDLAGKPVIVVFAYYSCEDVCWSANKQLEFMLKRIRKYTSGRDYQIVTISFDERDDISSLHSFVRQFGIDTDIEQGWRFAIVKDKNRIKYLADRFGVKYEWSDDFKVYVHSSVFIFVSPRLRIAKYLSTELLTVKELVQALDDTIAGRIDIMGNNTLLAGGACMSPYYKSGTGKNSVFLYTGLLSLLLGILLVLIKNNKYNRIVSHRRN